MNAMARALHAIDWATDPANPVNIERARLHRQQQRNARRKFVNEALACRDANWIVLRKLSMGFGYQFLSTAEAIRRFRWELGRVHLFIRDKRNPPYSTADLRWRLVVARYFHRHGRELLAVDAREAA